MTHKQKLIALALAFNLLLVGALLAWLQLSRSWYEQEARLSSRNLSWGLARDLAAAYDGVDRALLAVSDEYQLLAGSDRKGALQEILRRQQQRTPALVALRLADARGTFILGSPPVDAQAGPVSVADRDYFRAHRDRAQRDLMISGPVRGRVSNRRGLLLSRRLDTPGDEFAGVVVGNLAIEELPARLAGAKLGPGSFVSLSDAQGQLLARYPALPAGALTEEPDARRVHDEDFIHGVHTDARFGFRVDVALALDDVMATWQRGRLVAIVLAVLLSVLSFIVMRRLGASWQRSDRALAGLSESEARAHAIVDSSPIPLAALARDGTVNFVNPAFVRTLGYTLADIPDLTAWWPRAFPDPVLRQGVITAWNDRINWQQHSNQEFSPLEVPVCCADGSIKTLLATAARLRGDEMLIALVDVSASKAAEAARSEAVNRLHKLASRLPGVIYQFRLRADGSMCFPYASEAMREIYHIAPESVRDDAMPLMTIIHADDLARVLASIKDSARTLAPWREEYRVRYPDGSVHWLQGNALPEREADGATLWHGFISNVDANKQADTELQTYRQHLEDLVTQRSLSLARRERQMDLILNNIPAAVGYYDKDQINRFANQTYGRVRGRDASSMEGRTARELLGDALYVQVRHHIEAVLQGEAQQFASSFPTVGVPNSVSHVQVHYLPDRDGAEVKGFFVVAFDIGDLVRAREAAEAASRAKSVFLANMSHEIRTPLVAITGMTHLVRRGGVTQQQAERLDTLDAASRHLIEILNAVLDLSKIEAGKFAIDATVVNLPRLGAEVCDLMRARAEEKGLVLSLDVDALPEKLIGDATRIRQALINYVNNAVKFTTHGRVDIRIDRDAETADCLTVRFSVDDTGPGISAAVLERLFAPFEQGDNSTSRQFGGTGLGLVITRKLAQLMGGEAGAHSTPGRGSRFWFTARLSKLLRPVDPQGVDDAALAVLRHDFPALRALVIDADAYANETAAALLEEAGVVVDRALDDYEALSLAQGNRYDLVLLDARMPQGIDTARRLREATGGLRLALLVTTQVGDEAEKSACAEAGLESFLDKPVTPGALFAAVLDCLRKSRTLA